MHRILERVAAACAVTILMGWLGGGVASLGVGGRRHLHRQRPHQAAPAAFGDGQPPGGGWPGRAHIAFLRRGRAAQDVDFTLCGLRWIAAENPEYAKLTETRETGR